MKRRLSRFKFEYQNLEPRQMLATIALTDGQLFIRGGSGADVATVSSSGNDVTASMTGAESVSFPAADVDSILFVGLAGNDSFTNNTSIDSVAFGQDGDDTLIGGSGNDRLLAGAGNDELRGNAGDDELRGGNDGSEELFGDEGNDRLFGGNGMNEIRGGDGDDVIFGGSDIDIVFGDVGNDELYPGHGENVVRGGVGDDLVIGGRENDEIFGEDGDDRIYSSSGDDLADGGNGDDILVTSDGDDTLIGGDGDDRLVGGKGTDRLEGGNGNDKLRGGEGDDELVGGANELKPNGFLGVDLAFFGGEETSYRVAGSDLFVRDMVGEDGTDTLVGVEWLQFSANKTTPATDQNYAAESRIEKVLTIQPIITSNSDGSNTAEYFGTAEQEAEIKAQINDIFYSANAFIEVIWSAPKAWNNTAANVGSGGTRPQDDANKIFTDGAAAGVTSSDPLTLNMFFLEVVPGGANLPENQTNGLSLLNTNGITFQVGDELPTFEGGRESVATVAAHEIAHNLGLDHVSPPANLMAIPITGRNLNSAQVQILKDSEFTVPTE